MTLVSAASSKVYVQSDVQADVNVALPACFVHVAFAVPRSKNRLPSNYTVLQLAVSVVSPCNFKDFDE